MIRYYCVQRRENNVAKYALHFEALCWIIIYNLTNDCTIISNTTVTNNMILHVSTFKMSSSGSSLCLAKIHTDFLVLVK